MSSHESYSQYSNEEQSIDEVAKETINNLRQTILSKLDQVDGIIKESVILLDRLRENSEQSEKEKINRERVYLSSKKTKLLEEVEGLEEQVSIIARKIKHQEVIDLVVSIREQIAKFTDLPEDF